MDYLVLLCVLCRGGLPAEAGALGGVLVLPPYGATRLVSDTLNLRGAVGPPPAAGEQGKGPVVI